MFSNLFSSQHLDDFKTPVKKSGSYRCLGWLQLNDSSNRIHWYIDFRRLFSIGALWREFKTYRGFFRTTFYSLSDYAENRNHFLIKKFSDNGNYLNAIKLILLYGSEIWGYFNPFISRFRNRNIPIDQIFSKLHCEKLHLKFCKFLLGVHKKSTNFAVQSELGRFPLHFDILKQILRFWHIDLKIWIHLSHFLKLQINVLKIYMKASNHHGMAPYNIFCKICRA